MYTLKFKLTECRINIEQGSVVYAAHELSVNLKISGDGIKNHYRF